MPVGHSPVDDETKRTIARRYQDQRVFGTLPCGRGRRRVGINMSSDTTPRRSASPCRSRSLFQLRNSSTQRCCWDLLVVVGNVAPEVANDALEYPHHTGLHLHDQGRLHPGMNQCPEATRVWMTADLSGATFQSPPMTTGRFDAPAKSKTRVRRASLCCLSCRTDCAPAKP